MPHGWVLLFTAPQIEHYFTDRAIITQNKASVKGFGRISSDLWYILSKQLCFLGMTPENNEEKPESFVECMLKAAEIFDITKKWVYNKSIFDRKEERLL